MNMKSRIITAIGLILAISILAWANYPKTIKEKVQQCALEEATGGRPHRGAVTRMSMDGDAYVINLRVGTRSKICNVLLDERGCITHCE